MVIFSRDYVLIPLGNIIHFTSLLSNLQTFMCIAHEQYILDLPSVGQDSAICNTVSASVTVVYTSSSESIVMVSGIVSALRISFYLSGICVGLSSFIMLFPACRFFVV